MRYLKTYNESIERGYAFHTTDKQSIYDCFESLKTYNWYTSKYNQKHSVEYLSKWTDHFVGPGWWNKISSHVDKIFNKCKEVDLKHINDGTGQRRFAGTNLKPRKPPENAQTPTGWVHAVLLE